MANYDSDPIKVKAVQTAVNNEGYSPPLVVDGVYGPKTAAGVRWFQGRHGLTQDGIIGDATMAATIAPSPSGSPAVDPGLIPPVLNLIPGLLNLPSPAPAPAPARPATPAPAPGPILNVPRPGNLPPPSGPFASPQPGAPMAMAGAAHVGGGLPPWAATAGLGIVGLLGGLAMGAALPGVLLGGAVGGAVDLFRGSSAPPAGGAKFGSEWSDWVYRTQVGSEWSDRVARMQGAGAVAQMGSELSDAVYAATASDRYAIGQNLGGLGDAEAMLDSDDSVIAGDMGCPSPSKSLKG